MKNVLSLANALTFKQMGHQRVFMRITLGVSLLGMLGSFSLQALGFQPCIYCWILRFLVITVFFVSLIGLKQKSKEIVAKLTGISSVLGVLISAYLIRIESSGSGSLLSPYVYALGMFLVFGSSTLGMMSPNLSAMKRIIRVKLAATTLMLVILTSMVGAPIVWAPLVSSAVDQESVLEDSEVSYVRSDNSLSSRIDPIIDSGKIVFLYFWEENWVACRLQKPILEQLEQEYFDEVVFVRVDGPTNRKAMAEWGVRGFPTMFLIYGKNAQQYEYKVFEGYTEKSVLKSNIDKLISPVVEPVPAVKISPESRITYKESTQTSVVEAEPEKITPKQVHSGTTEMEFNMESFTTANPYVHEQGNSSNYPVSNKPLSNDSASNEPAIAVDPLILHRISNSTLDLSRLSGGAWAALTGEDMLVSDSDVPMASSPVEPPFDSDKLLPERASGNSNNEPTIAVNPLKPNNLVAGYHDYDGVRYRVVWSYSFDGGQTWTYGGALPVTSANDYQADPVLAADELGNFYYCYMSVRSDTSTADIVVAKSTDGGRTFPTYSIVYSGVAGSTFPDKNWIDVNTWPNNPYTGRIYVTYTLFSGSPTVIRLHYSTNRGATWSAGIIAASSLIGGGEVQGSQPSVAPDGRLYVALLDRGTWPARGDERVTVVRSSNGGVSIDLGPVAAVPLHASTNRDGLNPSIFRGESFPFIDVGPEGNVYVVYAHDPGSTTPGADDDGNIGFTVSTNMGVSWTNNWKVNDDTTTRDQWWPAIKVEEDDGTIHLVWLDRRLDAADTYYDTYYAYSTDGGSTFPGSDVRVSTVASNPGSDTFIGDYIDVDASAYRVHPIWTDRRTTNEDIYASRGWKKPMGLAVISSTGVDNSVLRILDELGHTYDYYSVWSDPADFPDNYHRYNVIIEAMSGGTVLEIPRIADFITQGGRAILLGGSQWLPFVTDVNTYLMSVDTANYFWSQVAGTPDITVVDPSHPLAKDLPLTYNFVDSAATWYMLRITDPIPQTVAMNGDGYKAIVTKRLGYGRFTWFINSPDQAFWTWPADYGYMKTFLRNALKPADIAVITTTSVDNSVLLAIEQLGYAYDYYYVAGSDRVTDFPADYSVYRVIVQAMDGGTLLEIPRLADYVNGGGRAILLGGSAWLPFVNDVNTYLMSVNTATYSWTQVAGTPDITVVDPNYQLARDLPATYDFVDSRATYYMLRITDTVPKVVATNGDGYKAIVTKILGSGRFTWFINSPYYGYWADPGDYGYLKTFLRNALGPADIAVISSTTINDSVLRILDELGYYYDYYFVGSFPDPDDFPLDYSVYKVIIQAMDGGTVLEIPRLADFVNWFGGRAILLGGSALSGFVSDVNTYLMGVDTITYSWSLVAGSPHIWVFDPAHPLAMDLPATYNFVDLFATFYMLRITDPTPQLVAVNGDGYNAIVTKRLGYGRFTWFINSPYDGYWTNPTDYGYLKTFLRNALGPADIAVISDYSVNDSVLRILDELGYYYDHYFVGPSADPDDFPADYNVYKVIVQAMTGGTVLEIPRLADFINNGGRAILLGGSAWLPFVTDVNTYLMSVDTVNYWWSTVAGTPHIRIVDSDHPLARDLPGTYNFIESATTYYMLRITDPTPHVVAMNGDGYKAIVTKRLGYGRFTWFINAPYGPFWWEPGDYNYLKTFLRNAMKPAEIAVISTAAVENSVLKILDELGYYYDFYSIWPGAADFPANYSVYRVIVQAMNGGTVLEIPRLADFINDGGRAILLGGSALSGFVSDVDTYLMDVDTGNFGWSTVAGTPHITVVDPAHALAKDLPLTYNFVNLAASLYMLRITDTVPKVVAMNGDGYKAIVTKRLGNGRLTWFINNPAEPFWTNAQDYGYLKTFLRNAMKPPVIAMITTALVDNSVLKALDELGYTYDYYSVSSAADFPADYSRYNVIIEAMNGGTVLEIPRLADFINDGGRAILLGGSAWSPFVNDVNTYLMSVDTANYWWSTVAGSPHISVVDPSHPLAKDLPLTYNFVTSAATYYMLRITDSQPHVVAMNGDGYKALVTKRLGYGRFTWFINNPAEWFWTNAQDYSYLKTFFRNALMRATGFVYDYTISERINPPLTGDWVVNNIIEGNDTEITLNGNLLIYGELRLNNVLLMMNVTNMENPANIYRIEVYSGGALYINSKDDPPSIITNGLNATARYTFKVNFGAAFEMRNSELYNTGYAWNPPPTDNLDLAGLWIAADGAIIENNIIDKNYAGMIFYNSGNHRIFNNLINSSDSFGIFGINSTNNVIEDNTVRYNGWNPWALQGGGIRLYYAWNSFVNNNAVYQNWQGYGIALSNARNSTITSNVVNSNGWSGIVLSDAPNSTIVSNTVNSNGWNGIELSSGPNSTIVSNIANSNIWDGIVVSSSENTEIVGNTADGNGDDGIVVLNSSGSNIADNAPDGNGDVGIYVSSSPNTNITRNTANSNYHGIYVSSSSNTRIINNTANLNNKEVMHSTGIYVTQSGGSTINVNIVNFNMRGIYLESSSGVTISNNTVSSSVWFGIHLESSPSNLLIANLVEKTTGEEMSAAIYLSDSEDNQLTINTVDLNWRGMILWYSPFANISLNVVTSNGGPGISLEFSGNSSITENDAISNYVGISLQNSHYVNVTDNTATNNSNGISLAGSNYARIINNNASSNTNGITFSGSHYGYVYLNLASDNSRMGIHLDGSQYNEITENVAERNRYGIYLAYSSSFNDIISNTARSNYFGISLLWSSNGNNVTINQANSCIDYGAYLFRVNDNVVNRNDFSSSRSVGIYLEQSGNNQITNNDARSAVNYGINLFESDGNLLDMNDVRFSTDIGIELSSSDYNNVTSNLVEDSGMGVSIRFSSNNRVINNTVVSNLIGIYLTTSQYNEISENNASMNSNIGIELSSSNYNNVTTNFAEGNSVGISVRFSSNNRIIDNDVNSNNMGIYLFRSNNNEIFLNNASMNSNVGIELSMSNGNEITGNTVEGNSNYGIHLYSSESNILSGNNADSNGLGIYLEWSVNNIVTDNTANYNDLTGIALFWSSDNNQITFNQANFNLNVSIRIFSSNYNLIEGNNASRSAVGIYLDWSENNTILNNTANLNTIHAISLEWLSDNNQILNNSASGSLVGISLDLSRNNTVSYNNATFNKIGILLEWSSNNNTMTRNIMAYNDYNGLSLHWESNYNLARNNTIGHNYRYGVYVYESSNNTIYHNDIIYNIIQAFDLAPADNYWHHPGLLEGNYWSDYPGADDGSGTGKHAIAGDGIGDTDIPWPSTDYDFYPLMSGMSVLTYDVAIIDSSLSKNTVGQSYLVSINATVENQGAYTKIFNVRVYANITEINRTEFTLTAGSSINVAFTWDTASFAKGNYTIRIYVTPIPVEIPTGDTLTSGVVLVTIAGDINGDGTVDVIDLAGLANAYGSIPTSSNWNPNANIDCNGIVDVFDLQILGKNFGKIDP